IFHDPSTTPTTPLRPSLRPPHDPLPKIWGSRPSAPGLTPPHSNEKKAFSRRNELPRGRLRSMKMPQEKNGENTDLYCAETWTLRKEDIRRLEAFEMRIWRRTEISWTEHLYIK